LQEIKKQQFLEEKRKILVDREPRGAVREEAQQEMAMAKWSAYEELLDMAARVAVRTYTHLPQTSRAYYKPPQTTTTATTNTASASRRSSADFDGDASSTRRKQQQEAAVRAVLDATEIIVSGVM
jgi:hypothetical protein